MAGLLSESGSEGGVELSISRARGQRGGVGAGGLLGLGFSPTAESSSQRCLRGLELRGSWESPLPPLRWARQRWRRGGGSVHGGERWRGRTRGGGAVLWWAKGRARSLSPVLRMA